MKVRDFVEKTGFKVIGGEKGLDREINGGYICDLLSWVMSHGKKGNAWITVQIHPNIIAIASLLEIACIIIPESLNVEEVTIDKANQENIPIISADINSYEICRKLIDFGV